jgi:hypothetical protein
MSRPVTLGLQLRLVPEDKTRPATRGDLGVIYESADSAAIAACEWLWANVPMRESSNIAALSSTIIKAGNYHNHLVNEDFSDVDRHSGLAVAQYLCTPSRRVKKLSREGEVILK